MVYGEEQPLFRQVGKQAYQVIPAAADLAMLAFRQVVDPNVGLRPAWHSAGDLLADKEVRVPAKLFRTANGVVVC
jgi:hypothetical protein